MLKLPVTLLSGTGDFRPARIRQAQGTGNLIKGLAGSIVMRAAQHGIAMLRGQQQAAMTAGDHQGQVRISQLMLDIDGMQMPLPMMHSYQGSV